MTPESITTIMSEAIKVTLLVGAPMLLVGLFVGLSISVFSAVTQIQEMTLVFVPKILAIFVTMLVALPFMGDIMSGYMNRIAEMIVAGG